MTTSSRPAARHVFDGVALDRAPALRADAAALGAALADPESVFVPVHEDRSLFDDDAAPLFVRGSELPARADLESATLLGVRDGVAWFALDADPDALLPALSREAAFLDLKPQAGTLPAGDAAVLAYARAMVHWRRNHRHCGACGTPTAPAQGGHLLRCPACGRQHFPRTDPAIIVLVRCGERALLARHPAWRPRVFATLAGFLEPGESLEGAVEREVAEEVGLRLARVDYHSSQPWPFPGSIMVGFTAEAEPGATGGPPEPVPDPAEIEEARWLTRAELRAAFDTGEIVTPSEVSIAWRLIEDWLGEDA